MRRKRIFVPALLVTGVIYIIAIFWSIGDYEAWKQEELEEIPSHLIQYVDFPPYIYSQHGMHIIMAGALITLGWLIVAIILSKGKLKYY